MRSAEQGGARSTDAVVSVRSFPRGWTECSPILKIHKMSECILAENLKIIPLGGLNEIGKNMTVYEYGGEIIVVDCGMAFPGDDMYGIDLVIPDVSYLTKHKNRIRGLFITHGHEDHIGAIPYVLKQVNMPIYCTRLTAGLIRLKLEEHGLLKSTKIVTVESGMTVKAGKFSVEFIHVNHSIADSVAFAIHTGLGTVVHTGDFKIDSTPIDGEVIDLARFGELGKQGVLALLADSTNVERPGYTMSERMVGKTFDRLFAGCKQRIIVTTFASNVHRIQQVIDAAAAVGRKVAVTGLSMENVTKVAVDLGYMKLPKNTVTDINKIKALPLDKQVIVTTGSQGEEMSARWRFPAPHGVFPPSRASSRAIPQGRRGHFEGRPPPRDHHPRRHSRQREHRLARHQRAIPQGRRGHYGRAVTTPGRS